ncbi:MAG: GMP synthase [glutamine-hydrolyzing] [Hydrogenibacillus schlegelii]|uniref:GMP synthase [glutamine-hydrolyzing] n=2 Tax=Hydrogenibacillus schlegelii TaxID=1484 RepID=A0A2T5G8C9_HYDSH|nr:MAG: GMP synthase [glutamine-hydrolyzing] [Hydrogenibacillus schlegelii]
MSMSESISETERVVVLDFGGQYSQLIARRIRELGAYCEIWPYTTPPHRFQTPSVRGLILSGGPSSVYDADAPRCHPEVFELDVPILGICYGMQLMVQELGGQVERADRGEYGKALLEILEPDSPLLKGLQPRTQVWMSHVDSVKKLPPGFRVLASTEATPIAVIGDDARRRYGVQFHPEVVHTLEGNRLLENFLYRVVGMRGDWKPENFVAAQVESIRREIGAGRALCALSGGVDSAVAAALVYRAIGDRLTCLFVDHGFLRKGEREEVMHTFQKRLGVPLVLVNAADRFLRAIQGVVDPEEKRRRIGHEFIRVFEEEARRLGPFEFLVQGTIYPDVVESGATPGAPTAVIKTHHNVGGLPPDLRFRLVEPLRSLFKDEVRAVGRELGLSETIVTRHPFPGPGLAIRVLGEVTEEKLAILREADAIFLEEIRKAGLYEVIWQAFAVLVNSRSVAVMGDERRYGYTVALRAVTSEDGMTADYFRFSWDFLERVGHRITREVPNVSRVVYDITSKPPATIEWE